MADVPRDEKATELKSLAESIATLATAPVEEAKTDLTREDRKLWNVINDEIKVLNGTDHFDPDHSKVRYVASTKRLKIPEYLVNPDPELPAIGHEEDRAAVDQTGPWLADSTIWSPREEDMKLSELHRYKLKTVVVIAALNLDNAGGHVPTAYATAFAVSMGLVNHGNTTFSKEWVTVRKPPSRESLMKILKFTKLKGRSTAIACDLIAFVGYRRISRTHIYESESKESKGGASDLKVVNRILEQAQADEWVADESSIADVLHTSSHPWSMGGAIGFFYWWVNGGRSGPLMRIRSKPIGDKWKPIAIAIAGYDNLTYLPILGPALSGLRPLRDQLSSMLDSSKGRGHRTSSLSVLVSGDQISPNTEALVNNHFVSMMSAMIAGACEAGYLSKALGRSYYVQRMAREHPAIVAMWAGLFAGFEERIRTVDIAMLLRTVSQQISGPTEAPAIEGGDSVGQAQIVELDDNEVGQVANQLQRKLPTRPRKKERKRGGGQEAYERLPIDIEQTFGVDMGEVKSDDIDDEPNG